MGLQCIVVGGIKTMRWSFLVGFHGTLLKIPPTVGYCAKKKRFMPLSYACYKMVRNVSPGPNGDFGKMVRDETDTDGRWRKPRVFMLGFDHVYL
jgi:hypothetical protein